MSPAALFGLIGAWGIVVLIVLGIVGASLNHAGKKTDSMLRFERFRMAEKVTAWLGILDFGVTVIALVVALVLAIVDFLIWLVS